ncbi:aldo/keto reductase (plasmid) [Rhizobium leguminosarum bv. viciae]|nr:aldo/keto reductase [Rhizobium leguminosarum bv. viciae]
MDYRKLGPSGTVVTAYCLGTMTFGAEADEAASHKLLDDYFARGGNFIDTADVYSAGKSEEIIGRWLKARPTEARQAIVATKGRFPMGNGSNDIGLSRRHLSQALDDLAPPPRPRADRPLPDACPDALTPIEETLRFLDDAVSSGKIGYYGFSNYVGWHIAKASEIAKARGYTRPVTLQPQYNLLVRDIELEIVAACQDAGMGLLPWSPLGGGWLTGKYKRDEMPTGATRLGENPNRGGESYAPRNALERTRAIIGIVEEIAKAHGVSMAQVALGWTAAQPAITSVILGARTPEQLADNLGAMKLKLSDDDMARLNEVSAPQPLDYPYGKGGINQRHRKIEGGR